VCERGLRGGGTRGHGDSTENSEEPFAAKMFKRPQGGNSKEEFTQVIVFAVVVYFLAKFFIFFTFIYLQQPSFAFIGEGSDRGFWGGVGHPARTACAGWSRLRQAGREN
jgi:hypothetical protein